MSKRIKKKVEKRKRMLIHEALDIVLDINGLCESKKEKTGNHPTCFFRFSGHVAGLEAEIYPSGWEAESMDYIKANCYLDRGGLDAFVEKIKEWRN